jgi:hypothetical protein
LDDKSDRGFFQLRVDLLKCLNIAEPELDSFFSLKDNLKAVKLSEPSDRAIVYTNGDEPYFLDLTGMFAARTDFKRLKRTDGRQTEQGETMARNLISFHGCFPATAILKFE